MAHDHLDPSPLTFLGSDRFVARTIGRPVQSFLRIEAGGGLLLLLATAIALVWVNSPWGESYHAFVETDIEVRIGDLIHLQEPLEAWVNDAVMTVFFFVVGLEIKRELVAGQLRDRRAALLPAVAALGGMVVPAAIYLAFNAGGAGADGWGIPMATDIAFAVGVVSLLGSRVPSPMKVFLLTLAIVDDIGAIAVIALFYTEGLSLPWLVTSLALIALVVVLRRLRVWYIPVYVVVGLALWYAVFESGVHATIAGVVLGLITPAVPLHRPDADVGDVVRTATGPGPVPVAHVRRASFELRERISVAERLEAVLHPFTSYLVVPLFALVNAGIELSGGAVADAATSPVTLGVAVGLVAGKLVGVSVFTFLGVRLGVASLPPSVRWAHVVGIAAVAGVGFTVSLFVTGLAFESPTLVDEAKIGILSASTLAAVGGLVLLSRVRPAAPPVGAGPSAREPVRVG